MATKKRPVKRRLVETISSPDVIIDRAALTNIKRKAVNIASSVPFPKNLEQEDIQYWLMFKGLATYLAERKVHVPFEIKLESQDRD